MTVMKGPDGGIDVWHELERKRGLWKDRKQWFGKRIRGEVVLPRPPGEVAGVAVNSRRARLRERHWFSEETIGWVGGG